MYRHTLFVLLIGTFIGTLLSLFPATAPTFAWLGVLTCFAFAPVVAFLEYLGRPLSPEEKDYDDAVSGLPHNRRSTT